MTVERPERAGEQAYVVAFDSGAPRSSVEAALEAVLGPEDTLLVAAGSGVVVRSDRDLTAFEDRPAVAHVGEVQVAPRTPVRRRRTE
ncbi:MAG: hypothetical protein V5A46_12065 [Haloferacaceae archaeon]